MKILSFIFCYSHTITIYKNGKWQWSYRREYEGLNVGYAIIAIIAVLYYSIAFLGHLTN